MTTYEQEIFNLLTQPENYRAAKQVASQLASIEKQIRADFVADIHRELESSFSADKGWIVSLSLGDEPGVYLTNINWQGRPSVGFDWSDGSDFGIVAPIDKFDRAQVFALLQEYGIQQRSKPTDGWPWYEVVPSYSLAISQDVERILPKNRTDLVRSAVHHLQNFLKKNEGVMEKISGTYLSN